MLARFYEQQGDYEEAERQIKETIAGNQENIASLGELGNFYARRGDLKAAEGAYLKMAEMVPEQVAPATTLGAFYTSKKDWERALTWMNKALALKPESLENCSGRASWRPQTRTLTRPSKMGVFVRICTTGLG